MATAMAPAQRSVLREGIVAGLIGAAVVAVWFLFFDIARGRPFLTPGLLGAAVFQGVTNPTGLEITVANVVGYTLIHGLAFIAFGVVAASLMAISEREPTLFVAFVILFAAFEVFFFGVVGALGRRPLLHGRPRSRVHRRRGDRLGAHRRGRAAAAVRLRAGHLLHRVRGALLRRGRDPGQVGARRAGGLDDLRRQPPRRRGDARLLLHGPPDARPPPHRSLGRRRLA